MKIPTDDLGAAIPGLWCPWAEVLCLDCHGRELRHRGPIPESEWNARNEPVPLHLDDPAWNEGIGKCHKCGRPVMIRRDVAELQAIGDAIAGCGSDEVALGHLQQTGGMCAAATFEGKRLVVVSIEDRCFVGSYVLGDVDWNDPIDQSEHDTLEDAVAAVRRYLDTDPT